MCVKKACVHVYVCPPTVALLAQAMLFKLFLLKARGPVSGQAWSVFLLLPGVLAPIAQLLLQHRLDRRRRTWVRQYAGRPGHEHARVAGPRGFRSGAPDTEV